MIFNEELDKSLYLIVKSDKKNKEDIENLILNLPSGIYLQIQDKLKEYKEYENENLDIFDLDDLCLHSDCNFYEGRFRYSFVIDLVNNSLSIIKSMLISGEYKEYCELTLYMKSRYNNIESFNRQCVGSFTNYVTRVNTEYDLINTLFGLMIEYSNYDYKKMSDGVKKYKRINMEMISREVESSDNKYLSRVRKFN